MSFDNSVKYHLQINIWCSSPFLLVLFSNKHFTHSGEVNPGENLKKKKSLFLWQLLSCQVDRFRFMV